MFVALIPMQDVRLFELLMALAVKFLFEKILRKACTGLLVLDEVKKTLSEAVLYKLVGIFSTKDLQHSTPALTFLKEIAENIPKDDPKAKEKKNRTKRRKKRRRKREQGKQIKEEGAKKIPDKEPKIDFTVGCAVVTKAAKQKAACDGQKGKVEQVLTQHLNILLLTGPSKGECRKLGEEISSLELTRAENLPDQSAGQKRKAAEAKSLVWQCRP